MEKVIYTVQTISEDLSVTDVAVYSWIYSGKLGASRGEKRRAWEIFEDDYLNFLKTNKKYLARHMEKVNVRNNEAELGMEMYNFEGYPDPTAYTALRRADSLERYRKMIHEMFKVVNYHGFKVEGRITFIDKKTGKVYR